MSCLCHKLLTRQFPNVTDTEAGILRRTWKEAPHLFHATPPTPPDVENPAVQSRGKRPASGTATGVRKHPRTLPDSFPNSLIPERPQDQPSDAVLTPAPSATATNLEKTYSYQNVVRNFEKGGPLDIQQGCSVYVRIFLALERTDQFKRICCYAFAGLHEKSTSVDLIVQEIQDALHLSAQHTRRKIYHFLHIGNRWMAIVEQFASIVKRVPQQLTGLLCLLGSGSAWERASTEDCRFALINLYRKTDICERTLGFTPFVSKTLGQISLEHSFIDETRMLTSHSKLLLGAMPVSKSSQSCLAPRSPSTRRALHTVSEAEPAYWKASSLATISEAVPGPGDIRSEDANILLVLLCFLATSQNIPLDLLFRGAMPRKRWNAHGEIEEMDAIRAGLVPEVGSLLSDIPRLINAFHELELSSAVSKKSDQTYTVDEAVVARVCESLSPELYSFWRCQALVVVYRSIPWKYIEPATPNARELFQSHLKHVLQAYRDGFEHLPASTRVDLALTLIEASRFPNMAWKRFTVGQAEVAARGLEDWYLHSCIAQSQCLLGRIAGDTDRAASTLGDLGQGRLSSTTDKRMHSAIGQTTIQRSLNCIQVEDLSAAKKLLVDWSPLDQSPSPMEEVVLFRKDMMLGRVLRFQGEFKESLAHLERSRKTAERRKDLIFDEDLRDLTCDLADTLRELDDPVSAEQHLRAEITRRDRNGSLSPGGCLLELSLAEALFAQRRFKEAEQLCLDIQSRPGLLKFEKLRLHITLAKIRHVDSDDEGATPHWAKAMVAIGKFPNESGATRIIVMSVCDILSRQRVSRPDNVLLDQSLETLVSLGKLTKPGGFRCWIAGLGHWAEYLQSRDNVFRSRM